MGTELSIILQKKLESKKIIMKIRKISFLAVLVFLFVFGNNLNSQIIVDSVQNQDKIKSTPLPVPQEQQQTTNPSPTVQNNIDSKLTGEWWTDSKDAPFAKISFGADGSFIGYTLKTDTKPYANGMYSIKDGSILISYSVISSQGNNLNNLSSTYTYKNYTVSDSQLQLIAQDANAYNYYLSKTQQK